MKVINDIYGMRRWSRESRRAGKKLAFVPTMGALHEGHLSLMREGARLADSLAVSIYVNPVQFGPAEDLGRYPRNLEDDLRKSGEAGADVAFVPADATIYPEGYQTFVTVEEVTKPLCGASRPTHFRGVTTVVAKLFNIVEPDVAVFGEKDFQQLVAIRRMVRDLEMGVEIVGCPIVREPDGLAMSSRNKYLSAEEREAATSLYRSLGAAHEMIKDGETDARKIVERVTDIIESARPMRVDYAELVNADTLARLDRFERPALLALAAFAGNTRLIDNRLFK
jgi:pantoate--beta-alanine ligase